ncbi:MAG: AfsR/SARP family transcriptional regulator, partial [Nocardioidaceae bacterium]
RRFEAQRLLARARSLAGRSDIISHLLVRIYGTMIRAAADPAKAMAVVRVAEQELRQLHSCEPCSMGYLTTAAVASAQAGQLDRARTFLTEAERISGMWQGGVWSGAVWEARGHLRHAEGDEHRARAMFREASEAFARAGDQPAADRCRAAAGSGRP